MPAFKHTIKKKKMLYQTAIIIGIFTVIAVLNMWSDHTHTTRIKKSLSLPHAHSTVFVLIPVAGKEAVYDAADTLESLFSTADAPTRVHVGVVQHADEPDDVAIEYRCMASHSFESQVHVLRVRCGGKKARAARALGMKLLYTGQNYVLWTDAHTRFVRGWDTALLEELESLPSQSVLTNFHPAQLGHIQHVCAQNTNKIAHYLCCCLVTTKPPVLPLPSPFFSAAFAFGPASAFFDLSVEQNVSNACLMHTAQLLDRGWKMFCPTSCPVTHDWEKSNSCGHEPSLKYINSIVDALANPDAVAQIMGVDLKSGAITEPRVQQGLMPEAERTRDEMVCKVGTSVALGLCDTVKWTRSPPSENLKRE